MAIFDPFDFWANSVTPIDTVEDYRNFYETEGYKYDEPEVLTDPRMQADVTAAKAAADATGNTKLSNTLDFILKYGDKALGILTRNGVIRNQNLLQGGYSNFSTDTGRFASDRDSASNAAPSAANRVFNIDFTDPKTLIIVFGLLMAIGYFFFLNPRKNAKR